MRHVGPVTVFSPSLLSPAHALHFAVYEYAKNSMGGNLGGGHHPAIAAAAGAMATVVNEAIMTPVDVVKQRLQVCVGGGRREGVWGGECDGTHRE